MACRLTIKDIKKRLDGLNSLGTPLFRFVENIEQTRFPLDEYRDTDLCPVAETSSFEAYLEKNFSRDEDSSCITMNNANMLFFLMGGNRRLVSDNTTMSRLVNAKPAAKFYDLVISDLVNWKLSAGEDGGRKFVDCRKAGVRENAVSMIDYIVQENDLIISRFCSPDSQKALRELLREYAINICSTEILEPDPAASVKPAHADPTIMERDPVKKLAEFLDLTATMAEVSEDEGKQAKYLAEGLTWLLIASLLRGKFSAVRGELDKAFRVARAEADSAGVVETEDLSGKGKRGFVDSGTALYMKLMNRFHYTRDRHPSIQMMKPDPDLFPKGLPSIRNSERKASEGQEDPISIKDMVQKSWAEHKHLLLVGEGGIGKTITMLTLPDEEWLRELQLPALYIPLQGLDIYEGDLTSYIKDSYQSDVGKISALAETPWEEHPRVLLLLDGFNEIPMEYRKTAEKHIRTWMDKPGVQVITTSRISFFLKDRFLEYRLEPLSETAIRTFLLSSGLSEEGLPGKGDPLWKVINVPLMLAMFVQTDRVREVADSSDMLLDWKESDSAAHIIWDYLQMELYRLVSIDGSDSALCAAALLAIAPYVCYEMAKGGRFYADQGYFKDIIRKAVRFFSQNPDMIPGQVWDICDYFDGIRIEETLDDSNYRFCFDLLSGQSVLFQKEVSRRKEANGSGRKLEVVYVPAHQNFRDALAAVFISTCMLNSTQQRLPFPEEILSTADFYVKNYISEFLTDIELLKIWEYHRVSEPSNGHVTWILMDIIGRQRDYDFRELNFSGLDLTEINLHRLLSRRLDICPLPEKSKLLNQTKASLKSFLPNGHTGPVGYVSFSPDGKLLASGSVDKTIRVWDLESGNCRVLKGHISSVKCLTFSPNGNLLASASGSANDTRIWDLKNKTVQVLNSQSNNTSAFSVAFSPDGTKLACGLYKNVEIWDIKSGTCITLKGHLGWVNSLSFSLDGELLASGSDDKTIRVWKLQSGYSYILKGHVDKINCIEFSPNSKLLASGSNDYTVRIWNLDSKDCSILENHFAFVTSLSFSPDGRLLVSSSWDNTIIWDFQSNSSHALEDVSRINCVKYSPDGRQLALGSQDRTVQTLDMENGSRRSFESNSCILTSIAFSPDSKKIAVGSEDKTVRVYDLKRDTFQILKGHLDGVTSVSFSPNGALLASGSDDRTVRIWNFKKELCQTLEGHSLGVNSVAFSPVKKQLASASSDGSVRIWDIKNNSSYILEEENSYTTTSVSFSENGKKIARGSGNSTVRIWDLEKKTVKTLRTNSGWISNIAFSPKDNELASCSNDETIKLWNLENETYRILKSESGIIYSLSYSPNGKELACGSSNGTVYVWSHSSGCKYIFKAHSRYVRGVAYSPDGNLLASCSGDGTVQIWNANTGKTLKKYRIINALNLCNANFEQAIIPDEDKTLLMETGVIV